MGAKRRFRARLSTGRQYGLLARAAGGDRVHSPGSPTPAEHHSYEEPRMTPENARRPVCPGCAVKASCDVHHAIRRAKGVKAVGGSQRQSSRLVLSRRGRGADSPVELGGWRMVGPIAGWRWGRDGKQLHVLPGGAAVRFAMSIGGVGACHTSPAAPNRRSAAPWANRQGAGEARCGLCP